MTRPDPTPDASLPQPVAALVARLRAGDNVAAREVFDRYVDRLVAFARSRLSSKLSSRVDAEDVVQSVYRSFFVRLRDGQFTLGSSGDLWRLLATITLHKVHRQVEFHTAQKRAVDRETSLSASDEFLSDASIVQLSRDPSPGEAMAAVEELERLMRGLSPLQRWMSELYMQGHSVAEVARQVNRSERAVRRLLASLKVALESRAVELGRS